MSSPSRIAASERRSNVESRSAPLSETLPVRRAIAPSIMSKSAAGMLMSPAIKNWPYAANAAATTARKKPASVAALALKPIATRAAEMGSSNHRAMAVRADFRSLWSPVSESATAGSPLVWHCRERCAGHDLLVVVDDVVGDSGPSEALHFFVTVFDEAIPEV